MSPENLLNIESPDAKQINDFRDLVRHIREDEDYKELAIDENGLPHIVVGSRDIDGTQESFIDVIQYFTDIWETRHDFVVTYFSPDNGETEAAVLDRRYRETTVHSNQPRHWADPSEKEISPEAAVVNQEIYMKNGHRLSNVVLEDLMEIGRAMARVHDQRPKHGEMNAKIHELGTIRTSYEDSGRLNQTEVNFLMRKTIRAFQAK